jgi:hypothetical protein
LEVAESEPQQDKDKLEDLTAETQHLELPLLMAAVVEHQDMMVRELQQVMAQVAAAQVADEAVIIIQQLVQVTAAATEAVVYIQTKDTTAPGQVQLVIGIQVVAAVLAALVNQAHKAAMAA